MRVLVVALLVIGGCAATERQPSLRARQDDMLLQSAQALTAAGRPGDARRLLERLLAEHPHDDYGDAAHVSLGDLDFDRGDYAPALTEYAAVSSARFAAYARYKTAWCQLRAGDAASAIRTFVVVAQGDTPKLADAARHDLVYAFGELAPDGLASFDDARVTLLAASNGDPERAAAIGEAIAHHECAAGLIDACLATYRELAPRPDCPPIDSATPAGELVHAAETATPACRARAGDALGAIAMRHHHDGDADAETLYAAYLAHFGDLPAAIYFAGELAYARGDFCAAAPRYERYVRSHDEENRDEAAYADVLATMQCQHLMDVSPPASDASEPQPIPPPWQHVLAATGLYLATVKQPDPAVRFTHARILYAFAHLADASRELRTLATGTDELARNAAVLLADAEHRLGR
ncbi:MAG TPA: tetratricopeptide repeat protein [Kofleriaceae bacterium]|jgi:TolA-binding protein